MNWNWIPDIFFDFIGRLIPGFFTLGIFLTTLFGIDWTISKLHSFVNLKSILVVILVCFVLSYYLAIILAELCNYLKPIVDYKKRNCIKIKLGKQKIPLNNNQILEKQQIYKIFRKCNCDGNRLLKWKAENYSAEVIVTGTIISLLINIAVLINFWLRILPKKITISHKLSINSLELESPERIIYLFVLIFLILLFLRWRCHLEKLLEISLINFTKDDKVGTKIYCYASSVLMECVDSYPDDAKNGNKNCAAPKLSEIS